MATYPQTITYLTSPPVRLYNNNTDSRSSLKMGFIDACMACCGVRPKRKGWVYAGGGIYVPGQQVGRALWAFLWFPSRLLFLFFLLPLALECGHGAVQWYPGPRPSFTAAWISSTQLQAAKTRKPTAAMEHLVRTTRHLVHIKTLPDSCTPPPSSIPQTQTSHIQKHLQRSIHNGASVSPQVKQVLRLQSRWD